MGVIEAARARHHLGQLDQLVGVGVRPGRIVEARGQAERSLLADLTDHGLHVVELRPRGRAIVPAHRPDTHGGVAEDEADVDRDLVVEHRQLPGHGEPVRRHRRLAVEPGVQLDVAMEILAGLEGGVRVAVDADELGGDALAHLRLVTRLVQDRQARVRVHVDEARRDDMPAGVDGARRGERTGIAADDPQRVTLHAHGGVVAGVAAAVDDEAVTDQQIEHGHS